MQGKAGLCTHPALHPSIGGLPSAFLFQGFHLCPLPHLVGPTWLPASSCISSLQRGLPTPDLMEQGNQEESTPMHSRTVQQGPSSPPTLPSPLGPTCATVQLGDVLGILWGSDPLLDTRGTEIDEIKRLPKGSSGQEARGLIYTSSGQVIPTCGALQRAAGERRPCRQARSPWAKAQSRDEPAA